MFKRVWMVLVIMFLLGFSATAGAELGVNVEVIKVDGVSVVVLTSETTMLRARSIAANAMEEASGTNVGFVLPEFVTLIDESAFEGISAESVEVTGNVAAIEARAFADCKHLQEIYIPVTVVKIDDHAFDGCEGVTVYGTKGSEAERIANLCGFIFVDPNAEPEQPIPPSDPEDRPVELPAVKR